MTNGTSQGLLVIVAVVIFGIFVGISYLLFGEKLNTGLTNIFKDSLEQSNTGDSGGDNSDLTCKDNIKSENSIFEFNKNTGTIERIKYKNLKDSEKLSNYGTNLYIHDCIDNVKVKHLADVSITLKDINYSEGATGELPEGMHPFAKNLTTVRLPQYLETIGFATFYDSSKLSSIELPDSLKIIGEESFTNSNLKNIKMSKNIEIIENGAFKNSTLTTKLDKSAYNNLKKVDKGNPIFK